MEAPLDRLPVPGEKVGQYRVVAPLGRGGQGHVYKAECDGRFVVLKFFRGRPVDPWGELEIDILRHLKHPNVVRVLGYGRWPDPTRGYLYIVMEYVEGLTLEAHALEHNPTARQATTLLLKAARALAVVHRQRVLHRDVKPQNLLVRAADGEPVWVDFGVGHLEGRTTLPRLWGLPPGTPEFTSPEAYRFHQEHSKEQEHSGEQKRYQPCVADEVWAFGITVYWLLTDEWPFGTRADNPRMVKDILTRTPLAPHEDNPHVPVALGAVCMRMLRKEPRARQADMEEVAAELEAVLTGAGEDAGWDVPLLDPDALQRRTTEVIPGKVVDRDTWERVKQEIKAVLPRRGRVRKGRRQPPESPPQLPEPAPRPEAAAVAAVAPAPDADRRARSRLLSGVSIPPVRAVAVALVTVLLGALLLAHPWAVGDSSAPAATTTSVPTTGVSPLPPRWLTGNPALHALSGGELATSWESSKAGGGAALSLSPTPAPDFATAMLRKEDLSVNTPGKPQPQARRARFGVKCTTLACCAVLGGCAGSPPVRPAPKPVACPSDALEAMEKLHISIGQEAPGSFPVVGGTKPVTVNTFSTFKLEDELGDLRPGTVLSGRLIFAEGRVYGRFTQAKQTRSKGGQTYPVCLELRSRAGDLGVEMKGVGGPDSAVISSNQDVRAVDRFE